MISSRSGKCVGSGTGKWEISQDDGGAYTCVPRHCVAASTLVLDRAVCQDRCKLSAIRILMNA